MPGSLVEMPGAGSLLLFPFPFPEKGRKSRLFLGHRPILGHQKNVCPCRPPREGWNVNPQETQCLNPWEMHLEVVSEGGNLGVQPFLAGRKWCIAANSQFLVRWGHCRWISLFVESLGLMTWKNIQGVASIRFPTFLPRSSTLLNAANQQWKSLFDRPELGECWGPSDSWTSRVWGAVISRSFLESVIIQITCKSPSGTVHVDVADFIPKDGAV